MSNRKMTVNPVQSPKSLSAYVGWLGLWSLAPRRLQWNQSDVRSSKHQHPSSRETPRTKLQDAHTPRLELEVWCFSGAWSLGVGAFCAAVFHCFRRGTWTLDFRLQTLDFRL